MKNLLNFFTGWIGTFVCLSNIAITEPPIEFTELIKTVISIIGGILSSVIINWMNKKYIKKNNNTNQPERNIPIKK